MASCGNCVRNAVSMCRTRFAVESERACSVTGRPGGLFRDMTNLAMVAGGLEPLHILTVTGHRVPRVAVLRDLCLAALQAAQVSEYRDLWHRAPVRLRSDSSLNSG